MGSFKAFVENKISDCSKGDTAKNGAKILDFFLVMKGKDKSRKPLNERPYREGDHYREKYATDNFNSFRRINVGAQIGNSLLIVHPNFD